jgi:hypothetical protein
MGVEGGQLVPDLVTPEEVAKADRNGDGLICYKVIERHNVILDGDAAVLNETTLD